MKAGFSSKSDNATAYIQKSIRDENGRPTTQVVERLGTLKEIKEKYGCDDPRQWCRDYAKELTEKEKQYQGEEEKIHAVYINNGHLDGNHRAKLKAGDMFLLPLFHVLGLDMVFKGIQMVIQKKGVSE